MNKNGSLPICTILPPTVKPRTPIPGFPFPTGSRTLNYFNKKEGASGILLHQIQSYQRSNYKSKSVYPSPFLGRFTYSVGKHPTYFLKLVAKYEGVLNPTFVLISAML